MMSDEDLPYDGNYYRAQELGDYEGQRMIMLYRNHNDVFISLPEVKIDKNNCELEISYLDKYGSIENSICVIRKALLFGNESFLYRLSIYEWNKAYYHNIELLQDATKVLAVPISTNPEVYYLVKKKRYNKNKVDTLYSIYTSLYWSRHSITADISYSYFMKLSTADMLDYILEINA